MTCEDAQTLLHLSRPGERSEADQHSLDEHLRTCSSCQRELQRIRSSIDGLDRIKSVAPDPVHVGQETHRIMERIRAQHRTGTRRIDLIVSLGTRRWVAYGYGLATIIILFIMGWELFPRSDERPVQGMRTGPYVAYRVDASDLERLDHLRLPATITKNLKTDGVMEVSQQEVQRSAGLLGQAMLRSLSLSDDERRIAERVLLSLTQAAEPTIRFGKIGG